MKSKTCVIYVKKKFITDKKYRKVRDHCHYTGKLKKAAHNIYNLRYKIHREIPVVFHNGSRHDYHLIIKQLAVEFKKLHYFFSTNL